MRPVPSRAQTQLRQLVREQLHEGVDRHDPRQAWTRLWELGAVELVIPCADGGLGSGQQELCLLHEEVGRYLCDYRFVRSALLPVDLWQQGQATGGDGAVPLIRSRALTIDAEPLRSSAAGGDEAGGSRQIE